MRLWNPYVVDSWKLLFMLCSKSHFFNAKTTVIITRKFCKNISSQLLRNGDFKEAFSNTQLPRLCKHYCLHRNKCKTVSPKCYKHRYWKPKCSNHQDQAHHVQTSANVPFNWTLKRISAGKQRGPVVATLDCIKGHLEGMAALHPCLSLSLCQGQQGGSEWRVYCGLGKILRVRASLLKKDDPVEALHLCFFLQRSSTGEAALHRASWSVRFTNGRWSGLCKVTLDAEVLRGSSKICYDPLGSAVSRAMWRLTLRPVLGTVLRQRREKLPLGHSHTTQWKTYSYFTDSKPDQLPGHA